MRRLSRALFALLLVRPALAGEPVVELAPRGAAETAFAPLPPEPMLPPAARLNGEDLRLVDVPIQAIQTTVEPVRALEAQPQTQTRIEDLAGSFQQTQRSPERTASWWRTFLGGAMVSSGLCALSGCASAPENEVLGATADPEPGPSPRRTPEPAAEPERRGPELLTLRHPEVFDQDAIERRLEQWWGPAHQGLALSLRGDGEDIPRERKIAGFERQDAEVVSLYNDALHAGSGAKLLGLLRGASSSLATDQKLAVVQLFGRQFNRDYDRRRNAQAFGAHGAVDLDKLLAAAVRDESLSPGQPGFLPAGVCRDIASAQGLMLKALGFKDTYVVAFMDDSGEYHTTVVTRDRRDPLKFYKLDYDVALAERGKDGARSLFQGARDAALNYQIFEPGGRQVQNVPSELRKALTSISGTDVALLDPLARADSSLASYTQPLGSSVHARLFGGRDSTRSAFGGVEADVAYLEDGAFPGRISLALGAQQREGNHASVAHDFAYLQLEQKYVSPKVSVEGGAPTRAWFEATLNLAGMASRTRQGDNDGSFGFQADARLNADLRAEQSLDGGKIRLSHRVGAQFGPALRDVRNVRTVTVGFNHAYAQTRARIRLDALSSESTPVYAVAAALMAFSRLSARGELAGGLATDKLGVLVALEGRVSRGMPVYEEGARQKVRVTVYYRPGESVSFSGTVYRSLERDGETGAIVGLVLGDDGGAGR